MELSRREKQKEQVRHSIIAATRAIIASEGWQAVSIRKIADAIDYSLPVVYTHFESKDALLEEFVRSGFSQLNKVVEHAAGLSSVPGQQLADVAQHYFEFAFAQRDYYQMMFGLGMPGCERARQIPEIGRFGTIITGIMKNIHPPLNDDEKIRQKFHTFWSILHGLTAINMVNMTATPDEMQHLVLKDAIQGFIRNIHD